MQNQDMEEGTLKIVQEYAEQSYVKYQESFCLDGDKMISSDSEEEGEIKKQKPQIRQPTRNKLPIKSNKTEQKSCIDLDKKNVQNQTVRKKRNRPKKLDILNKVPSEEILNKPSFEKVKSETHFIGRYVMKREPITNQLKGALDSDLNLQYDQEQEQQNISSEFWQNILNTKKKRIRKIIGKKRKHESSQNLFLRENCVGVNTKEMLGDKNLLADGNLVTMKVDKNTKESVTKLPGYTLHETPVTDEGWFKCVKCEFKSISKQGLGLHISRVHSKDGPKEKGERVRILKKPGNPSLWPTEAVCPECGKTVKRGSTKQGGTSFEKHQMQHKVNDFKCECPEMIPPEFPLVIPYTEKERHMKVKHMNWHGCEICTRSFETERELKNHLKIHDIELGTGPFKLKDIKPKVLTKFPKDMLCPECGDTIGSLGNYKGSRSNLIRNHMEIHQVVNFSCDCSGVSNDLPIWNQKRVNPDFKQKKQHMKIFHMGWFGCDECENSFQTVDQLSRHKLKHKLAVKCTLCQYIAVSKESLGRHSCKPIPCPDCNKIMQSKIKLKVHWKKVHTSTPCLICGAVIKSMQVHMDDQHRQDSEKTLHCIDCGRGFMWKQKLEDHRMSVHIKSLPYNCRYGCDNKYNDRSNRHAHERRRHGKPFTTANMSK